MSTPLRSSTTGGSCMSMGRVAQRYISVRRVCSFLTCKTEEKNILKVAAVFPCPNSDLILFYTRNEGHVKHEIRLQLKESYKAVLARRFLEHCNPPTNTDTDWMEWLQQKVAKAIRDESTRDEERLKQAFSALKREGFVRTLLLSTATSPEVTEMMEANLSQLHSSCQQAQVRTREIKGVLSLALNCGDCQILEQAALRGYGTSVFGVVHGSAGYSAEQPDLNRHALRKELDQMTSGNPLQP